MSKKKKTCKNKDVNNSDILLGFRCTNCKIFQELTTQQKQAKRLEITCSNDECNTVNDVNVKKIRQTAKREMHKNNQSSYKNASVQKKRKMPYNRRKTSLKICG